MSGRLGADGGRRSRSLLRTQSGYKTLELKSVTLAAKETVNLDLILILDAATVTMGVIGYDSPISTPPGTTILSGETIRKLPVPQ